VARRPQLHPLRVSAIDRLTDDAVAIAFAVPRDLVDEYAFTPGQHVTISCLAAGDDARRTYSLCSSPGSLRIGVKRVPGGVFSKHALENLRVGDEIDVMTPMGRFTTSVSPDTASHRVAIVAGSGITPVLSIMSATLAAEPHSRFTLIYGNRSSNSVMFLDEIADLKDRFPGRLCVFHVLSREPRDATLLSGRLDRDKLGQLLDIAVDGTPVDEWFLCGPMAMVDTARSVLRARGVHEKCVRFELFHLDTAPAASVAAVVAAPSSSEVCDVDIRLAGLTTSLRVGRDQDVLHAALRVRGDVPYGCTNGMCGTCRAKLVEGDVEMDHCYALDDADLAAGFVLTCQAQPRTAKVTLDYDA
jgi:ring-1,2-phenylacetyl-CoA epoxidase subunit PaaE